MSIKVNQCQSKLIKLINVNQVNKLMKVNECQSKLIKLMKVNKC